MNIEITTTKSVFIGNILYQSMKNYEIFLKFADKKFARAKNSLICCQQN
ncbi:conserved hypothetical protein [Thermodesulfovibrio yellowstonii DSM 11347]|uniref:Uncharacterized protein n=1 Tax=Thermodesulfovibrio yellowstonii (strain ATCC 51303 / DSM 11347 / YP87) TaxID=289376 RepID=B5YIB8_THEYD|nr:conserved hypothetical protein [Thermodesulfovibrio yellowstonii DSM 11347]